MNLVKLLFSPISAARLIFVLSLYFAFVLNLRFWFFVFDHTPIVNFSDALFLFSLLFFIEVPFFCILNLLFVKKVGKPLAAFFILVSAGTQYMMLHYGEGVYLDWEMMQNVFETNPREAFDMLPPAFFISLFFLGILPVIWLLKVPVVFQSFPVEVRERLKRCLVCLCFLFILVGPLYKDYVTFGRNYHKAPHLINTLNYTSATIKYLRKKMSPPPAFTVLDEHPEILHNPMTGPHQPRVLVLVIGETARSANFSLYGYARQTNPLLSKQNIIAFQNTRSCGTATAVSLRCMLSVMTRHNFDIQTVEYFENFADLALKAGYDVYWKENDNGCKEMCTRLPFELISRKDYPKYCNDSFCYDDALLESLSAVLKNVKKDTLVILHTIGSHGPAYFERYPEAFKVFLPTCETKDIQDCTAEQIVNSYDNTILYTDYILSSVIDLLKQYSQFESAMIYLSDHGESLGEKNIYLHGLPYKIAPKEQIEVPFLVWLSENVVHGGAIDQTCLRQNALNESYSHDNLFHSVLGLLDVRTTVYEPNLDIFATCRK